LNTDIKKFTIQSIYNILFIISFVVIFFNLKYESYILNFIEILIFSIALISLLFYIKLSNNIKIKELNKLMNKIFIIFLMTNIRLFLYIGDNIFTMLDGHLNIVCRLHSVELISFLYSIMYPIYISVIILSIFLLSRKNKEFKIFKNRFSLLLLIILDLGLLWYFVERVFYYYV